MLKIIASSIVFVLALASPVRANMQSSSFRIFETDTGQTNYAIAPDTVISSLGVSPADTSATVTWLTDQLADGFVQIDSGPSFASAKEYGSTAKVGMLHNVTIAGLSPTTLYYFKVHSANLANSITYSGVGSFATAATPAVVTPQNSGGGLLIINKTDTTPPDMHNIKLVKIANGGLGVSWSTDEPSSSFVEYFAKGGAKKSIGDWVFSIRHFVELEALLPETDYVFRAISSDNSGNIASSSQDSFRTAKNSGEIQVKTGQAAPTEIITPQAASTSNSDSVKPAHSLSDFLQGTLSDLNRYRGMVTSGEFGGALADYFQNAKSLLTNAPAIVISNGPKVIYDNSNVSIVWGTDSRAGSQVALATAEQYDRKKTEAYYMFLGDTSQMSTKHVVTLFGLAPDTLYHFQLLNQLPLGMTAKSRDYTFKTLPVLPEITNYSVEVVSPEKAIFRWVTNVETDTSIKSTPYRGDILIQSDSKTVYNPRRSIIHQLELADFEGGAYYDVDLGGQTDDGQAVSRKIGKFMTQNDKLAPTIESVRSEIAIIPSEKNRAQVVISWQTNKSTTGKLYYQDGAGDFTPTVNQSAYYDLNFGRRHVVVISKFETDKSYSYRVESVDAAGNKSLSKPYTIYIPKREGTVIDLIIKYFNQLFGWLRNVHA